MSIASRAFDASAACLNGTQVHSQRFPAALPFESASRSAGTHKSTRKAMDEEAVPVMTSYSHRGHENRQMTPTA